MATSDASAAIADSTIIEVLRGRADSYRMFSRLFLKPLADEDIETLASMDLVSRAEDLDGTGLLAEGFNDMGRGLRKRNTGTRQMLATDFTMCFDGVETVDDEVAVPYASVFLGEKALFNQEPRNEVFKIFRAEGITLRSTVKLPEDHLSFELEFLAILSNRAAIALSEEDVPGARRNLELSRDFIENHILTWIGLLSERAGKVIKTRFYRGVMKATQGYLELDLETIADVLEGMGDGRAAD